MNAHAPVAAFMLLLVGCSTGADVPITKFYSYWSNGRDGSGLFGINTSYYEQLFRRRGPRGQFYDATERDFYHAARGDVAALHRFLRSADRDALGAPGEGWSADMAILALAYGDQKLAEELRHEPAKVREEVGTTIESELFKDRDRFIETRKLYKFRY